MVPMTSHFPPSESPAEQSGPHRIVLLRHGQTEWSESGQHTGLTDLPLTATGREQAIGLARLIAGLELVEPLVLSSPRRRAVDTAKLAGLAVEETTEDLSEWNYGDYEGLTTEQIREHTPGWTVWTHACPAGETAESVQHRADAILTRAATQTAHRDVVLVGHGHFSRTLLARWVRLAVANGIHFRMSPGGVAVLGHDHGQPQIAAMNLTVD